MNLKILDNKKPLNINKGASKIQFTWLVFLILSFAYDIPLIELTPFERVNPRLVDVATVLGVFLILPNLKLIKLPYIFQIWKNIVFWFLLCSVIWTTFWLPWDGVGMFSLFYAFRYLQGVLILFLALNIPLTSEQKKKIMFTVVAGGLFVALYAIPEYIRGDSVRQIAGGKTVLHYGNTLFSSLGTSYHHLAGFSSLSFAVAMSCVVFFKSNKKRIIMLIITFFISWPALFSGARSGLLAVVIISILSFINFKILRSYLKRSLLISLPFIIFLGSQLPTLSDFESSSRSLQRLIEMEGNFKENDISSRFGMGSYSLELYKWQGAKMLLIGGGFYVVPHSKNGKLKYRIGYGIHNSYLFPIEQAGVVAFFLFLFLLKYIYKSLKNIRKSKNKIDSTFGIAIWMFFITQILFGFFGGNAIWQSVGMENFSTYVLLVYMLACKPIVVEKVYE